MVARLSCCHSSLPGADHGEKTALAAALGLGVDLEFTSRPDLERFAEQARKRGVACSTLLAYGCHGLNPISDPDHRERFVAHVLEAGRAASVVAADTVVTAVYEKHPVAGSREIAGEIYRALHRELPGVRLLVECLNRARTVFLPEVASLNSFVAGLNLPGVGLAVDTGHAFQGERDVCATLRRFAPRIACLHLKDTDSRLPGEGTLDFDEILRSLREGGFQGRFVVECTPPGSGAVFREAIGRLQTMIRTHFP